MKSRQGVVNTRQSGAFVVPILFFYEVLWLKRRRKCFPSAGLARCRCVMWEMRSCVLRALTDGGDCGGGSSGLPHLGPPRMAGRGAVMVCR